MPKKTDDSTPAISNDISKNLLEAQLEEMKDTHFNAHKTKAVIIPSGSLKLDNYVKVKTGSVIRMGGPAEVGKTSQALLFAENFMKKLPNSKTFYINAEAKFGEEIQERTGMKFTTDPSEWEYGSVFVFNSNCFDTICDILVSQFQQIHEAGGHLCVIVDSVDMLRLKSSFGAKVSDGKKPAGVNYLTKEMFRHLAHPISAYNGFLIMITQYSATFTMDKYEKEAPNLMDGNQTHALNHQASYAFYYRPRSNSHFIKEIEDKPADPIKNKILGINVKIDVRKSATDETGYMIEIPIKKGKKGNCIWVEKELFDALFLMGLVTRKSSWIELSEDIAKLAKTEKVDLKLKHQGLGQFSDYFESNPDILKWLVEKVQVWHS